MPPELSQTELRRYEEILLLHYLNAMDWTHLVPRKKWNGEQRNVAVNDFIILADSNAVRGKWSAGRILQVFPGEDGEKFPYNPIHLLCMQND